MFDTARLARVALLGGLALAALTAPTSAWAQDVAPASTTAGAGADSGEIIVTARRREESEIDVPIAMTVNSAEQLDIRGAADITALQRTTPNLTLQVSRGTNSTLTAFIRGIGQQDPLWGFEPGVGLYVDDVYIARPQGAVLDIFDIERIEVLRGPQGTLYGRNTIGGAVKYVTRKLSREPEFKARAEVGTYRELNFIVSGSAPLTDTFRMGAALARYSRDGFGDNLTLKREHANRAVFAGRISLEFEPNDQLFFRLAADKLWDHSNINNGHRETPGFPVPTPPLADKYDTLAGIGYRGRVHTGGVSLTGDWHVSDQVTLRSITAYRSGSTRGDGIDFDGLPQPYFDIPGFYDDDQFSQELQAQLDLGRLSGVLGAYYMDATAAGAFYAELGALGITQPTSGSVHTKSYALFGDFSFDVTDRFSVSVGARWTQDDKRAKVFKANYLGVAVPGPSAVPFQVLTNYTNSRSFSEFTPRFSATYELFDDFNVYAAYGRGFKSGGFDMRGDASVTPATMLGYDPEIVDSYEAGFKSQLFGGRVRLTGAVFHASYNGQQVTTQVPVGNSAVSFVDNVGSSRINGAELEGNAVLADWLTANFALGYIDAKFKRYASFVPGAPANGLACVANPPSPPTAVGCYVDVSNARVFQNTPKWNGSIGLTVRHKLGDAGELALNGNFNFRSSTHLFETPIPALDQKAYQLFDLSAAWTSANDHWRFGVYARNLFDERYKTGGYNFPTPVFANSVISFYAPPRTVKATLEYRY
ncbi:TonB-dependent receptor [Sphingomonas sp. MAH-20]|uniref:TonB-dependent receptor n=1 Tax=Sphingomonas horti TaxID=2682842 RepID=A0A6I4J1L9_9SPHN|nr:MULTISPECIES: TonB-dependent receptor [Sphingomonas]MBA2920583.1 TonB-dependent receptor [Sphingomonas sp. CGMCC 1.13658]MVO78174.1 TonB-dependent receptor [Sphingomonas horti]